MGGWPSLNRLQSGSVWDVDGRAPNRRQGLGVWHELGR